MMIVNVLLFVVVLDGIDGVWVCVWGWGLLLVRMVRVVWREWREWREWKEWSRSDMVEGARRRGGDGAGASLMDV